MEGEEEGMAGSYLVLFDVGGGAEVRWWRGGGDGGILPGTF